MPSVLLIDVEGYELNVIKGGGVVIAQYNPFVIFEFHKQTKLSFGINEMRRQLGPNYSIFRLRQDAFLDSDVKNAWNCVAIPLGTQFEEILLPRIIQSPSLPPH